MAIIGIYASIEGKVTLVIKNVTIKPSESYFETHFFFHHRSPQGCVFGTRQFRSVKWRGFLL
jgi:hypothetical protein